MRKIVISNAFKKDLKLAKKRNCKIEKLHEIVDKLARDETLEEKYHDHKLTGNYSEYRECHITSDWLLIYRKEDDELQLYLFRNGTHSDLFSK